MIDGDFSGMLSCLESSFNLPRKYPICQRLLNLFI